VSSRERKRAARRKRKERSGAASPEGAAGDEQATASGGDSGSGDESPDAADPSTLAAEAEARGVSRSELRNEQARERLEPLAEGERPRVVTVGAAISLLIAASIVVAWLAGVEVRVGNSDVEEEPNLFQVVPPAILFAVMGVGMLRARYWAVLGFQAIMAIIMIGSVIALIAATSVFQAVSLALVLAIAGTLFWFTVKALARIQMPAPGDRTRGR
jgi:hypothetical protein